MTDRIGIELMQRIYPIVPLSLVEAETEEYPYAVYNIESEPVMTKDGVHHITASVGVDIVSNDFDEANSIAQRIAEVMSHDNQEGDIMAVLRDSSTDCLEGIWIITQNYRINQYK